MNLNKNEVEVLEYYTAANNRFDYNGESYLPAYDRDIVREVDVRDFVYDVIAGAASYGASEVNPGIILSMYERIVA